MRTPLPHNVASGVGYDCTVIVHLHLFVEGHHVLPNHLALMPAAVSLSEERPYLVDRGLQVLPRRREEAANEVRGFGAMPAFWCTIKHETLSPPSPPTIFLPTPRQNMLKPGSESTGSTRSHLADGRRKK